MTGVSFLIDTDWVIDHLNSLSPATKRLRELEPQGIAINRTFAVEGSLRQ